MGGADNTGVTEELVFGFGVALVGDDLAKDEVGGVAFGVELAQGFIKFGGVGGVGVVLGRCVASQAAPAEARAS